MAAWCETQEIIKGLLEARPIVKNEHKLIRFTACKILLGYGGGGVAPVVAERVGRGDGGMV
jgi:hypothetical protein